MKFYLLMGLFFVLTSNSPLYSQLKAVSTSGSPKQASSEILTNKNVVALHQAKLNAESIIAKIESSSCKFDLSTNGLVELKKSGIENEVIEAMLNESSGKNNNPEKAEVNKTGGKLPKLEIANHPYFYNEPTGKLKLLEKAVAGVNTKYKALGYGGVRFQYEVQGEKSETRLATSDSVVFLINTAGTSLPELVLYKVQPEKGKRSAVAMQTKVLGGMKTGENVIVFNIIPLTDGNYKIIPTQRLAPGEYFFAGKPVTGSTSVDVYTFGIN